MSDKPRNHLELRLRELAQLFNSMDPSPFHERDLDAAAEGFILDWARELPAGREFELVIRLGTQPDPAKTGGVDEAVRNYFGNRALSARRALRRLLRLARWRMFVALLFLGACLTLSQVLDTLITGSPLLGTVILSLDIIGWVALWRPAEIFLFDWWPLRDDLKLFERLARMPVTLVLPENN